MPVQAVRFIRRMRGGAQAHLLEASDKRFYVVKFRNNPQHRRVLVNEVIATEILKYLGIATPEHRIINVSPDFLEANPEVYIQLGTRKVAVEPGWHFGSRHPGNPKRMAIYDLIPDQLLPQVANAKHFRAVLVFDRWAANADGRQSVFFRDCLRDWGDRPCAVTGRKGFVALMIDHGYAFNGPDWDFPASPISGLYPRRIVYRDVRSLDDFEPWLTRAMHCPDAVFDRALRQLPPSWTEGDEVALERLVQKVRDRQDRIRDLLLECRIESGNPFPSWVGATR